MDQTGRGQHMDELASLVQLGLASTEQANELARLTQESVRPDVLHAVSLGHVREADWQDVSQSVLIKAWGNLSKWDCSRGAWMTWIASVTRTCIADYQRSRIKDMAVADALAGGVDIDSIPVHRLILGDPDALHDWDTQLGKWHCDGVAVDAAMLASLRSRIIKDYGLR